MLKAKYLTRKLLLMAIFEVLRKLLALLPSIILPRSKIERFTGCSSKYFEEVSEGFSKYPWNGCCFISFCNYLVLVKSTG